MPNTQITITNKFSNGNNSTILSINGNCQISNYKPNESKPAYFIFTDIKNGKCNIQQKNGNKNAIDFSNEKYQLMQKIAGASSANGKTVLSLQDLNDMNNKNLGLDNSFVIKKDIAVGVATIYKKVGNKLTTFLRFDFETNKEGKTKETSTTDNTKYATLPFIRYELGQRSYENKLKIPANTMLETASGSYIVDEKGKAYKFNGKTWERISDIKSMDTVSSKVIASIADNFGGNTDMTLNKADLKFKKDPKKDVIDRFNYYNAKPAYWANSCNIGDNSIDCNIESVFEIGTSDSNNTRVKVLFDVNAHQQMKEKEFNGGYSNAEKIYKQISGPSLNKNTLKLINGLSTGELLAAVRIYNNHRVVTDVEEWPSGEVYTGNGTFSPVTIEKVPVYNKNGMFKDLNDEWGLGIQEIMPIIDRVMNGMPEYLKNDNVYKTLQNTINSIDKTKDENFDDATIQKIDSLFGKLLE